MEISDAESKHLETQNILEKVLSNYEDEKTKSSLEFLSLY